MAVISHQNGLRLINLWFSDGSQRTLPDYISFHCISSRGVNNQQLTTATWETTVSRNTVMEWGAVYIRHLAQEAMVDSAWTVVTDIALSKSTTSSHRSQTNYTKETKPLPHPLIRTF